MSEVSLFYIPVASRPVGEKIARTLLEKKLVACANIFPPHASLYLWKGKVVEEKEHIMILKTQKDKTSKVKEEIQNLHPYDCPCILYGSAQSTSDFTDWIRQELS